MTVGKLREILDNKSIPDNLEVSICIETPDGFVCPDGALCDIDHVGRGFDWHMGELLIIPKYKLRLVDDKEIEKWKTRE